MRYPLVCFDLDGTLVDDTVSIWVTLHEHFNTDPLRRQQAQRAALAGAMSYADWFYHDLELFRERGADRRRILEVVHSLRPMPGAKETLEELRRRGHRLALISGSLGLVVDAFFSRSLFDYLLINEIFFEDDGRIAGGVPTDFELDRKADGLRHIAEREALSPSQCVFVGDNYNDQMAMELAGLGIAFNPQAKALAEVAKVVVWERDVRAILPHIK